MKELININERALRYHEFEYQVWKPAMKNGDLYGGRYSINDLVKAYYIYLKDYREAREKAQG